MGNRPDIILGIGNDFRGDDGAGLVIARELKKAGWPAIESDGEATRILEAFAPDLFVVCVDAVLSEDEVGVVRSSEGTQIEHISNMSSTHNFGLGEAIKLGKALGKLPQKLVVITVSGKEFGMGTAMSPQVRDAVTNVVCRFENLI